MKFHYKKYGEILRPVIPIIVKNGERKVGYEVLIDSGADLCIFDAQIGEILGIDVSTGKAKEVFGVGGKASLYYLHPISMSVGGWDYEIEAGFMKNVAGPIMPYGIVGQRGFFDKFVVTLNLKKEEIELK